ncbi:hypothetical protein I5Q34_18765 [Streptomyces sp. AV19]|uniref:hypothetical protein n=1 Tax=Streptomyces sp. AV19 TaxID=2793068 RepID=UPI0018FE3D5D|nr:hypothetical protein [Streptomyces sp. AV19]MBH1936293.1 hypothetical protein [Streptomyces sp. AV19]MDG4532328.1 hypothetical protein [Streptomyces sp. AV19]
MTSPPPPPPSNPPQPPGGGGGFGPPQGFGPPPGQPPGPMPPPAGQPGPGQPPYGQGQPGYGQGQQPGYGQGQGFGPYGPYGQVPAPPPPPPSSGGGAKIAAIIVGAVLVVGLAVGGVVLAFKGGEGDASAKSSPSPSASGGTEPSSAPSAPPTVPTVPPLPKIPVPSGPSASASSQVVVPMVVVKPGECFDHPAMTPSATRVEKKSCDSTHDGEAITNRTLDSGLTSESAIRDNAQRLCKPDAERRLRSINDGKLYYYFALYPNERTYLLTSERRVTCWIARSDKPGGAKLGAPLPG